MLAYYSVPSSEAQRIQSFTMISVMKDLLNIHENGIAGCHQKVTGFKLACCLHVLPVPALVVLVTPGSSNFQRTSPVMNRLHLSPEHSWDQL